MEVTLKEIEKAYGFLKDIVSETVMIHSRTFSNMSGSEVYLKLENFQKTGSFKIRGAMNKMHNLTEEEKKKGVITASAGNHAQGVAYAASALGIKSIVVMPEFTPIAKVSATKGYGAEVVLYGSEYDEAYEKAVEIKSSRDMTLVHAFNDSDVISGQGTIGIEMLKEKNDLDIIVVPIGGGGLISGIATAVKELKPDIKVIGVEASGFAAMKKSVDHGEIVTVAPANTIAEGIAVKKPGNLTFSMIRKYVDDIVTVTEEEIASSILMLLERTKLVVEGAGAASLAALLHHKIPVQGKKTGVVISGGNIDINLISMIIHKGLLKSGRKLEIKTILKDRPGQLSMLLDLLAEAKVNIISVNHNRDREVLDLGYTEVDMVLETRGREHALQVCELLKAKGYVIDM